MSAHDGLLSVRRGRVEVVLWERGRWRSMPHAIDKVTDGGWTVHTRCGCRVELSDATPRIAITALRADRLVALGCGSCVRAMATGLRRELASSLPSARDDLARAVERAKWIEKEEAK